jgi:hypothetical protein
MVSKSSVYNKQLFFFLVTDMSGAFPIKNGLKQGDALSPLLSTLL